MILGKAIGRWATFFWLSMDMLTAIFAIAAIHMLNLQVSLPDNYNDLPLTLLFRLSRRLMIGESGSASTCPLRTLVINADICISDDGPQVLEALHVGSRFIATFWRCSQHKRPAKRGQNAAASAGCPALDFISMAHFRALGVRMARRISFSPF